MNNFEVIIFPLGWAEKWSKHSSKTVIWSEWWVLWAIAFLTYCSTLKTTIQHDLWLFEPSFLYTLLLFSCFLWSRKVFLFHLQHGSCPVLTPFVVCESAARQQWANVPICPHFALQALLVHLLFNLNLIQLQPAGQLNLCSWWPRQGADAILCLDICWCIFLQTETCLSKHLCFI